jgi:ADP-ribose pyrophosphatase
MEHVKRIKVYEGFLDFAEDTFAHPSGVHFTVNTLQTKASSVAILPRLENGDFLLTSEFRCPTAQRFLSCPGGRLDPGEDPLMAAKRELIEETGYTSKEWTIFGAIYPYPAISDQKVFLAFADKCRKTDAINLDPAEQIDIHPHSYADILEKLRTTHLVDGIITSLLVHLSGKSSL